MTIDPADLKELQLSLADRIYLQIASWHLYLGDAGLAENLAIECSVRLNEGANVAARQALESMQVPLGGGSTRLPLERLIPASQLRDLEEILEPYCR